MKSKIIAFALTWLETIAVIGFCALPVLVFLGGLFTGSVTTMIVGTLVSVVISVAIFGGLFLMIQNNQTLKDIRALLQAKSGV